jgi:hypothetical protein
MLFALSNEKTAPTSRIVNCSSVHYSAQVGALFGHAGMHIKETLGTLKIACAN